MAASAKRARAKDAQATGRPGRRTPASAPLRADLPAIAPSVPAAREATVHETKTHLSRLLAEVEAGGSVVITRRGKPVAKLEAIRRRPVFGSMKGLISIDDRFFEPLPDEELEAWGLL